jgi:Zn-dependent protease
MCPYERSEICSEFGCLTHVSNRNEHREAKLATLNWGIALMSHQFATALYSGSTWVIPLVIAITFHEASHGYVARLCGDDTAWRLGRVSFNPLKHIDPFGTILLPALLLLMRSPILFGYAKPVPVDFRALHNPRRDSVFVAAAGPAMNFLLATLAALALHLLPYLPDVARSWIGKNLENALIINVLLAIFNLLPLLPLDGGRILVGFLPEVLAAPLRRLEPYGLVVLIGILFILPLLGAQLGVDLNIIWRLVQRMTGIIVDTILKLTGNT